MDMSSNFFNPGPFMPHGGCYLWTQSLIALHAISDGLIVLSYYSIPVLLLYFVQKRKEIDWKFQWVAMCFAMFVLACGTTHLMEIWNIWHANYWLSGFFKAITALVSVVTAILFVKLLPAALALPSAADLQKARDELEIRVVERTAELTAATEKLKAEITERKQAETALVRERMLLGALVEHLPVAVYLKDADGRKTLSNPVDLKNCGVTTEADILGKTDTELFRRDQAAVFQVDERRVLTTGQPMLNREEQLTGADGTIRWLLTSKVPLFDAAGRVTGLAGIGLDITERKQAEAALRESEERYNALFDRSLDCVFLTDFAGNFLDANPAALVLLGYQREEISSLSFASLLTEDQLPAAFQTIEEIKATGQQQHRTEYRVRSKDGRQVFYVETQSSLIYREGKPFAIQGIARDITERKQSEQTLSRLATAVEQSAETIVITDTAGKILYANPAFEENTGYTRAEAIGQNPRLLKSGKQDAEFYRQMWDVLQRGEVWHGHFINKRKDGTNYEEESTISPVRDATGKVINYVAVKRDVTHEMQAESQLRQLQKMEAIGTLAGGVAHDFNNILMIISMEAGLLKCSGGLSTEQTKYADEISATVERAAVLTRQLLLFSRREVFRPRDLDLSEAVTDTTKMLRRILGENIEVQLNLAPQPMFVHADPGMMDQVLLNLAVNARDAMAKGGQLIIATAGVELDEFAATQIAQARPGAFVCLSVADTGSGIPPEVLPKIFEPFYTTKDIGKGTGLGLATVYGIVQQHQGWINVYTEAGHGTKFKVYLPRLVGMSDQIIAQKMLATVPTGKETILLVEDEPALRTSVRISLNKLGYRVLEASTGIEALKIWKEQRTEIQLLLTDMMMSEGMTGKDLAQQLRKENPKLKVIYMSGYSADLLGKDYKLQVGVNFLAKPFQLPMLAQTVRNCLDKQTEGK
jgi:PAS domain S-box-containing protein